jgi:uncharacterized protein YqeY
MLIDRLTEDMKTAMKARESLRVQTLRFTLADLKNVRIEKGEDLTDEEVIQVLRRAVKRREESIEQYRGGGREDLAEKEAAEAEILRAYLPQMMDGAALAAAVDAAIAETGATSPKEMGKVMKHVMSAHAGKVDGKQVQAVVRERLGG